MGVRKYARHAAALGVTLGVALLVVGLLMVPAAGAKQPPPGCNGDIKTHNGDGEPSPIVKDEPKVCSFHLHGFNFDPGTQVAWSIKTQPGGVEVLSGNLTAGGNGEIRTGLKNLPEGQYKVFWHQAGCPGGDKHKVFKVDCAPPDPTATPTSPPAPTATPTTPRQLETPTPTTPPATATPTTPPPTATPTATPIEEVRGVEVVATPAELPKGGGGIPGVLLAGLALIALGSGTSALAVAWQRK